MHKAYRSSMKLHVCPEHLILSNANKTSVNQPRFLAMLQSWQKPRGGHSHRRRVQSCDHSQDAVKGSRHYDEGRSNGQAVFWGQYPALLAIKRRGRAFAHVQLINGQWVKGKNWPWSNGQGPFWTVKNLDRSRSSGHGAYGSDFPLKISVHMSPLNFKLCKPHPLIEGRSSLFC